MRLQAAPLDLAALVQEALAIARAHGGEIEIGKEPGGQVAVLLPLAK